MSDGSGHAPHRLGRMGERMALAFLQRAGWELLARNYRFGRREIDLIVRRGDLIAFVEVKTRTGLGCGDPSSAVTGRKRREIEAVAAAFLARTRLPGRDLRFDVISIVVPRGLHGPHGMDVPFRIEHIEDAWRPGAP